MDNLINIMLPVYRCSDFSKQDTLGVICRGSSLRYIKKYKKFFVNSFLVGQHIESLKRIGGYIKGYNIVLVSGSIIFKTNEELCKEFNIVDLQMGIDPDDSPRKHFKYHKTRKKNRWLTLYPKPKSIRERNKRLNIDQVSYPTTGIYAVDLACSFKPKNIHIIGLDFYYAPYFTREKYHRPESRGRGSTMIKYFRALCREEKNIFFNLYTCCDRIESTDNLCVNVLSV